MTRILTLALPLLLAVAHEATAQEWAKKMFKTTSHDFGTVARGSKQEFSFQFSNIYKEEVHIASVRSSCGCTSPSVTKDTLKTYETSEIVAVYNTKSFLGYKGATITVTIDRPFYAEVQLAVSGYIRSDVVFTPGVVDLGSIEAGSGAEAKVEVAFVGREDWQITDVRSANKFLEVELDEGQRGGGRVNYKMVVRLKPGAPAGYLQDQLSVVTDEAGSNSLSLPVEGQVISPLTVSPASVMLGVVKPGETVKKRLVVRGTKPFKIVSVKCDDMSSFKFVLPEDGAKTLQFVALEYVAGNEAGKVAQTIKIETDLGTGLVAECVATATVKPAAVPQKPMAEKPAAEKPAVEKPAESEKPAEPESN